MSSVQPEYEYDTDGNLIKDLNKGISMINYNRFNQATEIQYADGNFTKNNYNGNGKKTSVELHSDGKLVSKTEYAGIFTYTDEELEMISFPGGFIQAETGKFHYFLKDHLGNNRVVFNEDARVIQENSYYPFGLQMNGMHSGNTDINKKLYNGKELQERSFNYDYGFRQLDPQLGRRHSIDLLAEQSYHTSGYAYAANNPVSNVDVAGLKPISFPRRHVGAVHTGTADLGRSDFIETVLSIKEQWHATGGSEGNNGIDFFGFYQLARGRISASEFNFSFNRRSSIRGILKATFGTLKGFKFKGGKLTFNLEFLEIIEHYGNMTKEQWALFELLAAAIDKSKNVPLTIVFNKNEVAYDIRNREFNLYYGRFGGGRFQEENGHALINILSPRSYRYNENGYLPLYDSRTESTRYTRVEFLFWHEIGHYVHPESYMAIITENYMRTIIQYQPRDFDEYHPYNP